MLINLARVQLVEHRLSMYNYHWFTMLKLYFNKKYIFKIRLFSPDCEIYTDYRSTHAFAFTRIPKSGEPLLQVTM